MNIFHFFFLERSQARLVIFILIEIRPAADANTVPKELMALGLKINLSKFALQTWRVNLRSHLRLSTLLSYSCRILEGNCPGKVLLKYITPKKPVTHKNDRKKFQSTYFAIDSKYAKGKYSGWKALSEREMPIKEKKKKETLILKD